MNKPNLDIYNQGYHTARHPHLIENDEYFWARAEAATRLYFSNAERQKKVFEYGCGIGQGIALLPNAAGWDVSAEAREICKRRKLAVYDRLELVPRGQWDIVFCRHVLEHLENPLEALKVMKSLVADDGNLYLILPRERHQRSDLGPDLNQHLYCWNFRSINNLLHRAGFSPYLNRVSYVLGYRVLLPVRRLLGKSIYYHVTKAVGRLKGNGELIIRARHAPSRAE